MGCNNNFQGVNAGQGHIEAKTIEAEAFVLKDHDDKIRGNFFISEDNETVFRMLDEQEKLRFAVGALDDITILSIFDDKEVPKLKYEAFEDGSHGGWCRKNEF